MASSSAPSKEKILSTSKDIQAMDCMPRTQGDGMENIVVQKSETKQPRYRLGDTLIYHPTNLKQIGSIPPVTPTGTIVNLVPKHIVNVKDERHVLNSLKSKEPKFVPYEPYKAAVNPMVPLDKKSRKPQKMELNANVVVSQLADLKINEPIVHLSSNKKQTEKKPSEPDWQKEKKLYEMEIQKLKEENGELEVQLKFQTQVNGELKNLLVAAVGEDLETKVHLLTEDKLQLARALLNSSQNLSTHHEQTEWLAGQCEVWRSKFLASSLVVEELAKWKAALCQRTTDLQEAIKRLLEEHNDIRDVSLKMYRTLNILRQSFDPARMVSRKHELQSTNIVDLVKGCCQLAEILKVQLLSGVERVGSYKELDLTGLEMKTVAEKAAEQLVANPSLLISGRPDVACSAVMGAAVAVGGQLFLPRNESEVVCCPHCSGEIKKSDLDTELTP